MSNENKPNWNDAPEWANYLAQDKNGRWWWSESELYIEDKEWKFVRYGRLADCSLEDDAWKSTLQARPKPPVVSIDWNSVPEHLNYFAIDEDGAGFFFTEKPAWSEEDGKWFGDWTGISEIIQVDKMLLKRPK